MKTKLNSLGARVWVTLSFVILAVALELTMASYWSGVLEPRLSSQANSNAQLQAQSQAIALEDVLSDRDISAKTQLQQLQAVFDQLLLIKDPQLNEHFFVGLMLEVDYDLVAVKPGSLDLMQGDNQCSNCFIAAVQLYSRQTDELLGVATFYVSDAFFIDLKTGLKDSMFIEGAIVLVLLILVWIVVMTLVVNLYRQIAQRENTEKALIVAKDQAELANASRGQFLANMSHEIRTPMNVIIGLCYIVLKTRLSAVQRDHLTKVHTSAHSLLTLINDILDFSKIESGKLEIENIEFDRDEVLENLAQMVMPKAGEKGLNVIYDVAAEVPHMLKGDPFRLGQVLLNLANNAIKFTDSGEIVLRIELLGYKGEQVKLLFSVQDSGVGITEATMGKLFSSFTQADSSMSRKYGGTGLGLAICKDLVTLMKGEVWVESELGIGSTFYFSAIFDVVPPEAFNRFIIPCEIDGMDVLVVDDNAISRAAYCKMLRAFDFEVTSVASIELAVAALQQQPADKAYELVLMNEQLGDMEALQGLHLIKSEHSQAKAPSVILVGGWSGDAVFSEADDYLDAYLLKPICQSALYDCIVGIFCQVPRKSYADFNRQSIRSSVISQFGDKSVLLVEDNKTNQLVAVSLLDDVQLRSDCAFNGEEAIEMLKQNSYDLIFMDVQMPGMDGIVATQIIRQQLKLTMPIIAMTAHAMEGDKHRCMEAGMDDYITKPIDVDLFYQTLEKWIPTQTFEQPDNKALNSALSALPELPGIDVVAALDRLLGNQALLLKLLSNFKPQNEQTFKLLLKAFDEDNSELASQLVHSIKGESGNIAAMALFATADTLEKALNLNHYNGVPLLPLLQNLQQEIAVIFNTCEVAELALKKTASANGQFEASGQFDVGSRKTVDIQALLSEIAQLLATNNLKAKTLIESLSDHLASMDYEVEYNGLDKCMSVLDFSGALQHIHALSAKLSEKHK